MSDGWCSYCAEYDEQVNKLKEQLVTVEARQRSDEQQLIDIANVLGGDARDCTGNDKSIAGLVREKLAATEDLLATIEGWAWHGQHRSCNCPICVQLYERVAVGVQRETHPSEDVIADLRAQLARGVAHAQERIALVDDVHELEEQVTKLEIERNELNRKLTTAETREQKDIAEIQRLNQKCIGLLQEIERLKQKLRDQAEEHFNDWW